MRTATRRRHILLAAAGLCAAGQASAQVTTCMGIGPNMVNCNTTGPAPNQTHLLSRISGMIADANDRSIRKHVGELLAAGDCEGASHYALSKGRLELGEQIAQSCQPYVAPPPRPIQAAPAAPDLATMLSRTAVAIPSMQLLLDDQATLVRAETVGTQLMLTMRGSRPRGALSEAARSRLVGALCSHSAFIPLLHYGASVRLVYVDQGGRQNDAVMVTRQICGF